MSSERPYLSMCTIYRDQADLLPEWIEFHKLVGAERFFLYNNFSKDDHRDVLAPYIAEGTVVLHDWAVPFPPAVATAFTHCVTEHRDDSRWIAFLDMDEFLFSPTLRPVSEQLPRYEQAPAVGVVSLQFGTSGHVQQPPGLVIENFTRRWNPPPRSAVKSIVDPRRSERCRSAHWFVHTEGTLVDEQERPLDDWRSPFPSFERLQINHYWTMSEEAAERKFQQWSTTDRPRPRGWFQRELALRNDVADERITAYVPALREALSSRTASSGSGR
jgi:hypothetical protein